MPVKQNVEFPTLSGVYFMRYVNFSDTIKIGWSANIWHRIIGLARGRVIVEGIRVGATRQDESDYHKLFNQHLIHNREWFSPADEILQEARKNRAKIPNDVENALAKKKAMPNGSPIASLSANRGAVDRSAKILLPKDTDDFLSRLADQANIPKTAMILSIVQRELALIKIERDVKSATYTAVISQNEPKVLAMRSTVAPTTLIENKHEVVQQDLESCIRLGTAYGERTSTRPSSICVAIPTPSGWRG